MRAVLYDEETMCRGDAHDRIHIAGLAVEMCGDDGAGSRRNGPLELCGIQIECQRINVHKDRAEPQDPRHFGNNPEGQCGENNFRAAGDFQRPENVVERHPAVRCRDRLVHAMVAGETILKFANASGKGRPPNSIPARECFECSPRRARNVTNAITRYCANHCWFAFEPGAPKNAM